MQNIILNQNICDLQEEIEWKFNNLTFLPIFIFIFQLINNNKIVIGSICRLISMRIKLFYIWLTEIYLI